MSGKKSVRLLASILLYVIHLAVSHLFFETDIFFGNIACLSVFMISLIVLLAVKKRVIHIICLVVLHLALAVVAALHIKQIDLPWQALLIYCFVYVSVLFIILPAESFYHRKDVQTKKGGKKKAQNVSGKSIVLFETVVVLLSLVLIGLFISGKEKISAVLDATVFCYIVLFIVILICLVHMRSHTNQVANATGYITMCAVLCAQNALVYTFWGNQYVTDKVYLLYPLVLTLIYLFDCFGEKKGVL